MWCAENIILDERGWPHLADFGVAYVHHPEDPNQPHHDTLTCTLASGTKQYLGPEVFGKEHIHGPEADFWSLAVVAYELLFPKRPFEKHCAIEFITYLERALLKQRKLSREARVRELQAAGLNTSFADLSSCATLSPDKASYVRGSPSASASTSRESNTAFFPAVSRSGSFDNGAPHLQQHQQGLSEGYCSSVQYTPINTGTGHALRRSGSGSTSGYHSQASSRGSSPHGTSEMEVCGGGSEVGSMGCAGSGSMHRSCDRLEGLLLGGAAAAAPLASLSRPSTAGTPPQYARGISFDGLPAEGNTYFLPPLGCQSNDFGNGSTTPPRQAKVPRQGAFLPPASGASSPVKVLLQQQAQLQQQFTCNQKNPLGQSGPAQAQPQSQSQAQSSRISADPFSSGRLPYGDHWAVDEDPVLGPALRVHIPSSTTWGRLSPECIAYLKAAFDIRPSHRLSSRNIDAIRTHPWLAAHGLSDWQELYKRNYTPNFKPGKRFMREIFADPSNTMLPGAGNALHDPDGDSRGDSYFEARRQQQQGEGGDGYDQDPEATLPAEQQASFRGFRYTSAPLQQLFVNKEPDLPGLSTCTSCPSATTSAEALTAGSGGSSKMVC